MTAFGLQFGSFTRNAAVLLLLGSACSGGTDPFVEGNVSRVAAPIIGGSLATEADYPAVVALGGCSGTLVHPQLVVYAAHCGTAISTVRFGIHSDAPERVVDTERCRHFPGATLGDGTDLAYCVLAEPVLDIEPERILAGCELDQLSAGQRAIIVGYGKDSEEGVYGEKRFADSRIESVGDEIFLVPGSTDSCRGDSGGPVFIELREPDGRVQRRLVGVISAGTESECGTGVGHNVNVPFKLDWLENSSQLDLTPCFDQGGWSPTAACRATIPLQAKPDDGESSGGAGDGSGGAPARDEAVGGETAISEIPIDESERPWLLTCGAAFDQPDDSEPPVLAWTSPAEPNVQLPLPVDATFVEFELAIEAADAGWGVEQVLISLFDADGQLLFQRPDQIAPYGLPTLRVPPGRFTLSAEARDFAGNTSSASIALQVGDEVTNPPESTSGGGGCAIVTSAARHETGVATALAVLFAFAARRRRIRRDPPVLARALARGLGLTR
jgi:MYXO-CTERM domain-containing protein